MGYKLDQAGFLAAIPYLLMAVIVQAAGFLADLARTKGSLTTTQVRKLFTCGSYVCQTIFMTLTALLMYRGAAITCISLSLGCGGKSDHPDFVKKAIIKKPSLFCRICLGRIFCQPLGHCSTVCGHLDGYLQHLGNHPRNYQPRRDRLHRPG